MSLSVLIVDDEAPARRKLRRYVDELSDWQLIGEADSVATTVDIIPKQKPDLLLLDIQMRDGTGFDVLKLLSAEQLPRVVFITAYDQHAIQAFEVHAQDYLLKPVERQRFAQCVEHINSSDQQSQMQQLIAELSKNRPNDRLYVESGERGRFLQSSEIIHIVADRNYVTIASTMGEFRMRTTLSGLHAQLDPDKFVQTNRSTLVNLDHVVEVQSWFRGDRLLIMKDRTSIKLSRAYIQRSKLLTGLKL